MPETSNLKNAEVVFLYTNIGRGHPGYLDGLISVMDKSYSDIPNVSTDVFAVSKGPSLAAWKLVRKLYLWGGQGGLITALYSLLRKVSGTGEGGGVLYNLLGRDLKKWLHGYSGKVVVAHPIIARILSGQNRVIYQHGEMAAPAESLVGECDRILVPLEETAGVFRGAGIADEKLVVTGQCIETDLLPLAENAYENRLERIRGEGYLTAGLFSSGAYPARHMRRLRLAARSLLRAGYSVIFFAGQSGRARHRFLRWLSEDGSEVADNPDGSPRMQVLRSLNRAEDNKLVASHFDRLDFFVAPAHERTNWSVGLGLPQFILTPHIGSYAPLNAELAVGRGVAVEIGSDAEAASLGQTVGQLRAEGKLFRMAENGFGRTELSGFERAARVAVDSCK